MTCYPTLNGVPLQRGTDVLALLLVKHPVSCIQNVTLSRTASRTLALVFISGLSPRHKLLKIADLSALEGNGKRLERC
ncbi:hypothetical protein [Altericista sp. CCNU0014]|uniref:hypothetical protein n=1 Tax=Altericista sp. CCNU0014 TaxID=3082949 RepID=UPI00384D3459